MMKRKKKITKHTSNEILGMVETKHSHIYSQLPGGKKKKKKGP
jgi:hypothetical protein